MKLTPEQKQKLNSVEEYETYHSLDQLRQSDGGKVLVDGLLKDIAGSIDVLAHRYGEMTRDQMTAICAEIAVRVNTVNAIRNSKANLDVIVEEALKEPEE